MKYELVPPHIHIRNVAERAIQTFKDTFVGILNILTYLIPWNLCDEYLPQVGMNIDRVKDSLRNKSS